VKIIDKVIGGTFDNEKAVAFADATA